MTNYTIVQTVPYPIYDIDLSKLKRPANIMAIFRKLKIKTYVYTFTFNLDTIKHGISIYKLLAQLGERGYRQAGHLLGWSKPLLGSSGSDMEDIDAAYFAQTGTRLNRIGMILTVRDLTNMKSPSVAIGDKDLHVYQLERELIKDYEKIHNCTPIGNIKDEAHVDQKSFVSTAQFKKLFDWE